MKRLLSTSIVLATALAAGCASQPVFAPPGADEPHAELSAKFLNVRHSPDAAWGKEGFRPRLEICPGREPGCGRLWCYDCDASSPVVQSKVSDTSVAAALLLAPEEQTITAYTEEKDGQCRAEPLTIAPKRGVRYELVYSHIWSGSDAKSFRCAATIGRLGEGGPSAAATTAPATPPDSATPAASPGSAAPPAPPAAKPSAAP